MEPKCKDDCLCCKPCEGCSEFQKILDLKKAGLVIYRHINQIDEIDERTGQLESSVKTTDDVFIIENTNDIQVVANECIPETSTSEEISCPRCRELVNRAQKYLQNIPPIEKKDIVSVCDHCKIIKPSFDYCKCQKIVIKFHEEQEKLRLAKEQIKMWLSKIHKLLKNLSKERTIRNVLEHRALSELYLNKRYKDRVDSTHQLEVSPMFDRGVRIARSLKSIDIAKSESALTTLESKYTKMKSITLNTESFARIDKRTSSSIRTYNSLSDQTICEIKAKFEEDLSKNISEREGKYIQNNIQHIYKSEESLKKYYSEEDILFSTAGLANREVKKVFSYIFPKSVTDKILPLKRAKTSTELIVDTQEMLRLRAEAKTKEGQVKQVIAIKKRINMPTKKTDLQENDFKKDTTVKDTIESKISTEKLQKERSIEKEKKPRVLEEKKKIEKDQFKKKEKEQVKKVERDRLKNIEKDLSKKVEREQLKKFEKDRLKIFEKDQPKKNEKDQPKRIEIDRSKKDKKDQINMNEKDRPRKDEKDQSKKEKQRIDEGQPLKKEKKTEKYEIGEYKIHATNFKQMKEESAKQEIELLKVLKQNEETNKRNNMYVDKILEENSERKLKASAERSHVSKPYKEMPKASRGDIKQEPYPHKELSIAQAKLRRPSTDDLILELVKLEQSIRPHRRERPKRLSEINVAPLIINEHKVHVNRKSSACVVCVDSELELDIETIINNNEMKADTINDIIVGNKIVKPKHPLSDKSQKEEIVPILFKTSFKDEIPPTAQNEILDQIMEKKDHKPIALLSQKHADQELPKGIIRYALSDRSFIDKGWTMLPTEKVVRKMNIYRMRPAHPEFDWFDRNKNKRLMLYDTGEKLAEFDDNGRGRWFYRNGKLALDYYNAEEMNAGQRIVIYGSGQPDENGRYQPAFILATFDYLGNGVVFDHTGKIRLKYNQTEGIVLDRGIGPVSHWKWHTLNDPPVLQQVMIDTQMAHKDPGILRLGGPADDKVRPDNEEMLAIEFDNFIKEKSKKLSQKFKPFQIKTKALKINEHFSLKVLDQANIYLIYRDGTTNIKMNIGMLLDHQEIVDTDTAEVGEVSNNLERYPARTDSLAGLQRSVAHAQRVERLRVERERRLRRPEAISSADKLVVATSRPLRSQLKTVPSSSSTTDVDCYCKCRKPSVNNIYYDTRLM